MIPHKTVAAHLDKAIELLQRPNSGAGPELLATLRQCRAEMADRALAARAFFFQEAGRDDWGRPIWRVGAPENPRTFVSSCAGMRHLHALVARRVISIQQVAPDARNAGDAARNALKRALVELAPYCPRLAAELHNFRIDEKLGTVRYVPTAASPAINVGIASEYGADAKVA